jgi:hypothetical protein
MTWKIAAKSAIKKEMQPMRQITHWVLFLACGLTFAMKTVSSAAAASHELIIANPEIASGSWLVNGFFM